MTRWNRSTRPLALLVIGSLATSATAQPAPAPKKQPTQPELDRARAHFKTAEAAKARSDYKSAAAEYLAAYELFEDPEFFFDVGEVYRLGGDEPSALTYYQKYLELEPNGRGAAAARTAADELRRSIAAKQDDAKRKADDDAAKRKADDQAKRKGDQDAAKHAADDDAERKADQDAKRKADQDAKRKADQDAKRKADVATHANPPPTPEPPAPSGRGLRIAGLTTGGAGVVALGVGVVFGLRAKSISDEAAGWNRFDQARFDQGKAAERNMFILTGVGAAALITGGVLYYLGHRAGTTDDGSGRAMITFAPAIGHSEATFTAVGRF